ncbi:adenylate/guanylate cyclase domain-containing protein [bacterium]|nr:adenylate/guanylate cyclase domain-containing protein [bacterium]MCB2179166.1 adenylate/guanylate cyclase domain-containing protein [bacterium]
MPGILFTDIENSTRLWEEHAQAMSGALARHNEILRQTVEKHHGQVVKSTGDGILAIFESGNPLACAIEIQTGMDAEPWPAEIGDLRIRIGIHAGTYEPRGGDVYGADVNRAARVMDAGWGGQILITDDAKMEYKLPPEASLQDLGAHVLKDLVEPQALFGLTTPRLQQEFPPPRSLSSQPNNLPILPTTFIGREEEIKSIGDRLRNHSCQLVTLHGPGGIGKTRLSIEAGISFLKHYAFGVYFVPLAPMNDPQDLWTAIASAVGLPIYEDKSPEEQVLNYLKQKEMLLVLDNFEHLQAGAGLVGRLLDAAAKLQVIVTSRTRLQLMKECVFEVGGLQFPTQADAEIFENFEAVQLFTNLAQRSDPNFQLNDSDRAAIVEICKLMDGMPLGIELAANWVRVISPQEIVEELQENIDLLKTEMVDVPERHRSMRAMFDYSWKLLNEQEKQVLQALSIFRGGCTLAAAKAIAGASVMVISSLVDKSLVKKNAAGRYEMHELIRQLAEEKLTQDAATYQIVIEKHTHFYLTSLAAREADLKGRDQINALDELEADLENLRMAWVNAVETEQTTLLADAMESLFWMLTYRNQHALGQELFGLARRKWPTPDAHPWLFDFVRIRFPEKKGNLEPVYQAAVESAQVRGEIYQLAIANNLLGRYVGHILTEEQRGLEILNRSLALFQQLGDEFYIGHVLDDIAFTYLYQDVSARVAYGEKSLAVRERTGDLFGTAGVLGNLTVGNFWLGHFDDVEEYIRRALEIAQKTKDIRNIAWQRVYLAEILQFRGQFKEALVEITEAERICEDLTDTDLMHQVNVNKATIVGVYLEAYQEALDIVESSIPLDAEFNMHTPNALMAYGVAAAGLNDQKLLMRVCKFPFQAMEFVDTGSFGLTWFSPLFVIALYQQNKLIPAAECLGYTLHKGIITFGYAKKWALLIQVVSKIKAEMGESTFQEAVERGKTMDFVDFRPFFFPSEGQLV